MEKTRATKVKMGKYSPRPEKSLFTTSTESIDVAQSFKKLLTRLPGRIHGADFGPPNSPEEARIQLLANMVISLLFPGKKINLIISAALPEIAKSYKVVLQDGGGWSSDISKATQKKEKQRY